MMSSSAHEPQKGGGSVVPELKSISHDVFNLMTVMYGLQETLQGIPAEDEAFGRALADFNQIVKGRAMAYTRTASGYMQDMPFMNVLGNGGMLTTVGDWLIWNDALTTGKLGAEVTKAMTKTPVLTDGTPVPYARGLFVQSHRGFTEIAHSGGTAGYTTWLARYPDQSLSVALMCNTPYTPGSLPRDVADLFLPAASPPVAATPAPIAASGLPEPTPYVGLFADTATGTTVNVTIVDGQLRLTQTPPLTRVARERWEAADGGLITFDGPDKLSARPTGQQLATYKRVQPVAPAAAELAAYAGAYRSAEADAAWTLTVEMGALVLHVDRHPAATVRLTPIYKDAFTAPGGRLIRFRRNSAGTITAMSLADGRMRDLEAKRTSK